MLILPKLRPVIKALIEIKISTQWQKLIRNQFLVLLRLWANVLTINLSPVNKALKRQSFIQA